MEIEMKKILFLSFLSVMGMQSEVLCSSFSEKVRQEERLVGMELAAAEKAMKAGVEEAVASMEGAVKKTAPRKGWRLRVHEFFYGTPEQKAALKASRAASAAIIAQERAALAEKAAQVAAKKAEEEAKRIKEVERAAAAEQRRLDREYERDRRTRAYVRECRENKRPIDYSVYD